ncbi:TPA: hypothetical protein DIC20_05315 [Candidatus Dependentiae bacterium]|nr:MAG: Peptidase M48 Ste24p [candidate division TM6 bacterium GW2011_GWF2_36_131]KKQ02782.1 MAG: Peptidase M48 Ste24p [candidate division TM6 bacterium GW2011_GWE2_36_25]KKQ19120.1 MAG: Peptidase M48 Ste24p [candidate division TM6 bacterium GW2011_GWA2_36_9]HBR70133.1 hypothetical protein [Candidatus Dependentiae bacterium]HCU01085.1 hypothetical protein [Candidatus Dependentiae bacterium]
MFKFRHFSAMMLLLLLNASMLAGVMEKIVAPFKSARNQLRDLCVESAVVAYFALNSNYVVEADDKNYSEIDAMVANIAQKAAIEKPITFIITRKIPNFFNKVNAFTTGDKEKSVVFIGSWLIDNMTQDELEGIIAHEITHLQKNHILRQLAYRAGTFVGCTAAIMGSIALLAKYKYLNIDWNRDLGNLTYVALTSSVLPSTLLYARYSRQCEKEADLGALQLTGNKKIADSLAKFDGVIKKYLPYTHSQLEKTSLQQLFADHPKISERIRYIKEAELAA